MENDEKKLQPGEPGGEGNEDKGSFEEEVGKNIKQLNDKIKELEETNQTLKDKIIEMSDNNKDMADKYRKLRFQGIVAGDDTDDNKNDGKPHGLSNEDLLARFNIK